jgi:hypothetical protein
VYPTVPMETIASSTIMEIRRCLTGSIPPLLCGKD